MTGWTNTSQGPRRWRLAGVLMAVAASLALVSDLLSALAGVSGAPWFPKLMPWLPWEAALHQLLLLAAAWWLVRGPGRGQLAAEVALGLGAAQWLVFALGQHPDLPAAGGWVSLLRALLPAALAVAAWRRLRGPSLWAPIAAVAVTLAAPLAWALWLTRAIVPELWEGPAHWLVIALALPAHGGLVFLGAWLARDAAGD